MSRYPLVSIITPSLNQGAYISRAIESVFAQQYPHIEYIVMDGGSTDGTVEILKRYSSNPRVSFHWVSQKDHGQSDAINRGLKKAKGEIVGYLNSDDYYFPRTISSVAQYFQTRKNIQWVTGDYVIVNEKGHEIHRPIQWYKRIARGLGIPTLVLNSIIQPSTFWKRSVMGNIGFFDTDLRYAFDYDYWCRLLSVGPPLVIPDILSAFRIHKQSKGGSMYERQFEEELKVARRYTNNQIMLKLHQMHNAVTVGIYRKIK